jgi:hypothetical protein
MARNSRSAKGKGRENRQPENTLGPARDVKRRRGEPVMSSALPSWSRLLASLRTGREPRPRAKANKPILTAGVLPTGLAEQYHAQPGLLRRHIDYYEGDVAQRPAFRDRGGKLIAYQVDPTTIASLLSIAQHRGWDDLQVAGDRRFRRAVWLEATRAGLTVTGYRPSARDRDAAMGAALEATEPAQAPMGRTAALAERDAKTSQRREAAAPRVFQQGVAGLLVEHGQAPYQNQTGGKPTPFMRVDIGAAKPFEIWGVDLTKALRDAQIKTGDAVTLSWHGADYGDIRVQKAKAASPAPRQESADKPQRANGADRGDAGRESAAAPGQAHVAVVEAVARAKLARPKDRAQIGAAAKAKLAQHLARGSDFTLPTVTERSVRPAQGLGPAPSRPSSRERDR